MVLLPVASLEDLHLSLQAADRPSLLVVDLAALLLVVLEARVALEDLDLHL